MLFSIFISVNTRYQSIIVLLYFGKAFCVCKKYLVVAGIAFILEFLIKAYFIKFQLSSISTRVCLKKLIA